MVQNGLFQRQSTIFIFGHYFVDVTKCPMFKPSKEYLRVYKYQLREAVMAKQHAVMMGYTTIVEHNQEIIDYLSKIIVRLEGETHGKRIQDD